MHFERRSRLQEQQLQNLPAQRESLRPPYHLVEQQYRKQFRTAGRSQQLKLELERRERSVVRNHRSRLLAERMWWGGQPLRSQKLEYEGQELLDLALRMQAARRLRRLQQGKLRSQRAE